MKPLVTDAFWERNEPLLPSALRFSCDRPTSALVFGIVVSDGMGQRLFRLLSEEACAERLPGCSRSGEIRCRVPSVPLLPGLYRLTLVVAGAGAEQLDYVRDAATFSVAESDVFGTGKCPPPKGGAFFVRANGPQVLNKMGRAACQWTDC